MGTYTKFIHMILRLTSNPDLLVWVTDASTTGFIFGCEMLIRFKEYQNDQINAYIINFSLPASAS